MAEVKCPRCETTMRWLRRRNIYFCDIDGYILGPSDPFVKNREVIPAYNSGGKYNE